MAKKRLGVLTGGGDVPGLNIAIKSVVLNGVADDYEVIGIRRGWGGLLNYEIDNPATHEEYIRELSPLVVRRVDRTGGTFLHTSRTNPSKVRPKDTPEFLLNSKLGKVISEDGISASFLGSGDATQYGGAARQRRRCVTAALAIRPDVKGQSRGWRVV